MKRASAIICLCLTAISVMGQSATENYYLHDTEIIEKTASDVANKYAKGDQNNQLLLKSQIQEAFGKYFKNRKTEAKDVVGKSIINDLNNRIAEQEKTILTLRSENASLTKEENARIFEDSITKLNQSHSNLLSSKESEMKDLLDSIGRLNARIDELNAENNRLNDDINRQNANSAIFANINAKLKERQEDLARAYRNCTGQSLASLTHPESDIKATEAYLELLKLLDQPVPKEQQEQIAKIKAICEAAKYYQDAQNELAAKYNKKEVEDLLKKGKGLNGTNGTLEQIQKTELEGIIKALQQEIDVVMNFRNGILGSLKEEGSLPPASIKDATDKIDLHVGLFTDGDPNIEKDGYNRHYTHINKVLKQLRKGINEAEKRGFTNDKTYQKFLDDISIELGEDIK